MGLISPRSVVRFHPPTQQNFVYNRLGKLPVTRYNISVPVYKKVNKDFFKIWTTDMAYVLGFFAADGYITVNKRGGQFWAIDIIDKSIVEKIKRTIEAEHKISTRKTADGKSVSYRLQIGSIEMCDDLRRLGYAERKTKNLSIPHIPSVYFSHFVRGYFDGDGNVWVGAIHKDRKTKGLAIQTVFTSCCLDFLERLSGELEKHGILRGRIREGRGGYYRLVYSINSSLKLYDFMYNGYSKDSIALIRKKRVFERFKRMRS